MQGQRLRDLRADPMQRVQRAHRLLKDHRDAVAAQLLHFGLAELGQIPSLEAQLARDDRAVGQQPHQGERGHRLA